MKRRWKQVALALVFTISAIVLGSFTTNKVQATQRTYQIGTDVTYPPFEFANDQNKYVGIDIDLMKAIAKEEGFKVRIKPVGFNAAVQSLEAGQLDGMIAGTTMTPERKQKMDFSTPYFKTGVVMAVSPKGNVKNLHDLRGKKVAIKTGTAAAAYALKVQKQYGFKTVTFDDSDNMYNDVVSGNSVACFEDIPVMQYAIRTGVKLKIVTKPAQGGTYGFSVKKGENQDLLIKFNDGLRKLKQNGEYDKIVARYLGNEAIAAQKEKRDDNSVLGLLKQNWGALSRGLEETLYLTVVAIICATLFGVIIGFLGVVPNKFANGFSTTVIYIFRGLPLLVLALFIYSGVPNLTGQKIPAFIAGIITLTLNEGAYTAAFVKGGIEAVDGGQMEAARSLGLPYWNSMRRVILPQGLKIMVPSFINQFIITLKDTSILSIIGILELTQTGKIIIARNFEGFKIWAIIGLMYLIIITLLTWLSNWVEKRMNS